MWYIDPVDLLLIIIFYTVPVAKSETSFYKSFIIWQITKENFVVTWNMKIISAPCNNIW